MTAFDTRICYEECDGIMDVGLLAPVMTALSIESLNVRSGMT